MPAQLVLVRPSGMIASCSGNTRLNPPAARDPINMTWKSLIRPSTDRYMVMGDIATRFRSVTSLSVYGLNRSGIATLTPSKIRFVESQRRSGQEQGHTRVTLVHRRAVGRAFADAGEISEDIGVGLDVEWQEVAHRGQREYGHDICGGECAAREIGRLAEPPLDVVERAIQPFFHEQNDRIVIREVRPAQDHISPHDWLKRTVSKMEPVEVGGELGVVGGRNEAAVAVLREDIVHDGA